MATMDRRPAEPVAPAGDEPGLRLAHLPQERGTAAIPELSAALGHPDAWIRLHAVQGLSALDAPDAHAALARALHDSSFGVHWIAARTLADAGRPGVVAVLRALVHDRPSTGFLHGAAHVLAHAPLTAAERSTVAPVLEAIHRPAADLEASVTAFEALGAFSAGSPVPAEAPAPWYRTWRRRRVVRPEGEARSVVVIRGR
jgi:HEAT repeat protein